MPNTLGIGDILAIRLICNMVTQYSVNVRHVKVKTLTAGAPTDQDVAIRMEALFAPLYKQAMSNVAQWWGLSAQIIKPTPKMPAVSFALRAAGDDVSDALPPQTAGLVSLRTNQAVRGNRGRIYVPFPAESMNGVGADPIPAYVTDLNAIGAEWTTDFTLVNGGNTVVLTPVLYHRKTGTTDDIKAYVSRPKWATQRRRSLINRADFDPLQ